VRVARVLVSAPPPAANLEAFPSDFAGEESALPRAAILRDDAIYDVEALEAALGASIDRGDPSDFHARVATLRCAGLYDLDARLLRGERPSSARIPNAQAMLLAPCDTDRASLIHVDTRLVERGASAVCRIGQARSLLGQDALIGVRAAEDVELEVSIAVVIGDDLASADSRAAAAAIMGYAIFADWIATPPDSAGLATVRGVSAALGPALVSRYTLPKLGEARASVRTGEGTFVSGAVNEMPCSIPDAVSMASRELELRSGDVVAVGPLPRASSLKLKLHQRVEIAIDGLGALCGTAVARR